MDLLVKDISKPMIKGMQREQEIKIPQPPVTLLKQIFIILL